MAVSKRIRTDLALETTERFAEENTEIRGVEIQEDYDEEKDVTDNCRKDRDRKRGKGDGETAGNLHYNRSSGSVRTG